MATRFHLLLLLLLASTGAQSQSWEYAALANQAQRNAGYIGGEGGQWPQALAIDQTEGSILMHGSDVGGIWRSTDGGNSWEPANSGFTPRGTCGIFIDPGNPARALAIGANSLKALWNDYHGLYLTTDTARTWRQVMKDNACGYRDIREQIAFDPSSFDTVKGYCTIIYYSRIAWTSSSEGGSGTKASGLYKSLDGGLTWNFISGSGVYDGAIIKVHPSRGYLYAANRKGLFKSTDQGKTFRSAFSGDIKGMDIAYPDPSTIILCTSNKLYISADTGEFFTQKATSGFTSYANYLRISPVEKQYLITQHSNPSDPWNTYYLFSHDGGSTWTKTGHDKSLDFLPRNLGRLMYPSWHPNNKNMLFAVGGDFITRSDDGGATLTYANNGASAICSYGTITFNLDNPDLMFLPTQDYDASVSVDGGQTFKYLNMSGNGWGGDIHGGYVVDSLTWFGRKAEGWADDPCELQVTFDGGKTYINKGISGGISSCYGFPGDRKILFAGDLRSEDRGLTWQKMSGCQGVLAYDSAGNTRLFGINNGHIVVGSEDKGVSWQPVTTLPGTIKDLACDPVSRVIYAACFDAGLWKIYLNDSSVIDLTAMTPGDQFNVKRFSTVAVDPVNPVIVYAGGSRDIYSNDVSVIRSTDGGDSWIPLTVDLRHNNPSFGMSAARETNIIRVNPETRHAWCAGSCFGVWKIGMPDTIPPPQPRMRLNQSRVYLKMGESFQLVATFYYTEDTLVNWNSSDDNIAVVDTSGLVAAVAPGSATITAQMRGGDLQASCQFNISAEKGPFGGNARLLPGIIEAEDFDTGGEGSGYHDASLSNEGGQYRTSESVDIENCSEGGFNVGWTAAGEWLEFSVDVADTGRYNLEIRTAVNTASKISIAFSKGNISTGEISMAATGGWQNWKTFAAKAVLLNGGSQLLRINMITGGFNINYLKVSEADPTRIDKHTEDKGKIRLYPNPVTDGTLAIELDNRDSGIGFSLFSVQGELIYQDVLYGNTYLSLDKIIQTRGIYYAKFADDEFTEVFKLVIQ